MYWAWMAMAVPGDQPDITLVSTAHLAWTFTVYVPGVAHECEAPAALDQPEKLPSPQSNRYSTPWPWEQTEPPLAKMYDTSFSPRG